MPRLRFRCFLERLNSDPEKVRPFVEGFLRSFATDDESDDNGDDSTLDDDLDDMGQVMHGLGEDLSSARSQVNELVGTVLERRVEEVEAQARVEESTHQVDQRTALARDAINQIGEAAKALLLSKGLSPESAELVKTLSSHPKLMAAMQEPEVQALLSSPILPRRRNSFLTPPSAPRREPHQA